VMVAEPFAFGAGVNVSAPRVADGLGFVALGRQVFVRVRVPS